MFQLTDDEAAGLRLHFETSKRTSLLEIVFLQPRDLHEPAKQFPFSTADFRGSESRSVHVGPPW